MIKQLRLGGNKVKSAYWSLVNALFDAARYGRNYLGSLLSDYAGHLRSDCGDQYHRGSHSRCHCPDYPNGFEKSACSGRSDAVAQENCDHLDYSQLSRLHRCILAASHRRRKLLARW